MGKIMKLRVLLLSSVLLLLFAGQIAHTQTKDYGFGINVNQSLVTIPLSSDVDDNNQIIDSYTGVALRFLYRLDDTRFLKLSAGYESYGIAENSKYLLPFDDVTINGYRVMLYGIQYHSNPSEMALYSTLGLGFVALSQDFKTHEPEILPKYEHIPAIDQNLIFSVEYDIGLNYPFSKTFSGFAELGALLNFQKQFGLSPQVKLGIATWFD